MIDERNNPDESGTDNVEPSDHDTPEFLDSFDPNPDTEEEEENEGTDDETDEAEAANATEEGQEADDQQDEDEPEVAELEDTVLIRMSDGSTLPLSELKRSPLLQADYSRKTQELATERKAFEANAQRLEAISDALIEDISAMVPDPPPYEMAFSDPQRFTQMQAAHQAAMQRLEAIRDKAEEAKGISKAEDDSQFDKRRAEENQKLAALFPETARNGEPRNKFFKEVAETATGLGFTMDELSGNIDHRLFALAHWAGVGMRAEKAKATAKAKGQKAPPATPRKPGQGAKRANRNGEAMAKLGRSGRLDDALAVDFDF